MLRAENECGKCMYDWIHCDDTLCAALSLEVVATLF